MTQEKKHQVKVWSTATCPYCVTLKTYLEEKGIEYEHIDVSVDKEGAQEMIKKSGQMGVPVSDINGEIVIGFDKAKINQLLNIKE